MVFPWGQRSELRLTLAKVIRLIRLRQFDRLQELKLGLASLIFDRTLSFEVVQELLVS